jgi:hypothetical protein
LILSGRNREIRSVENAEAPVSVLFVVEPGSLPRADYTKQILIAQHAVVMEHVKNVKEEAG